MFWEYVKAIYLFGVKNPVRNSNERRELLNFLLSNSTWDGVSIGYEMKKPFDILAKGLVSDNWLPVPRVTKEIVPDLT